MDNLRFFILLLFLISIAFSFKIIVDVKGVFDFKVENVNISINKNVVSFKIFLNNIGSLPFFAVIKSEINNSLSYSEEKLFYPGKSDFLEVYDFINNSGEFEADLKAYIGNEIFSIGKFKFNMSESFPTKNIFEVKMIRFYENKVKFILKSREDTNAIIKFDNYPKTFFFEVKKIFLEKNKGKVVELNYKASPISKNITLKIFDDLGNYYFEKEVEFKIEKSKIKEFFDNLLFWLFR